MVRDPFDVERLRLANAESQADTITDMERRRLQRMAGGDHDSWQTPEPGRARPAPRRSGMTASQAAGWHAWAQKVAKAETDRSLKLLAEGMGKAMAGELRKRDERIAALEAKVKRLEAQGSQGKVLDVTRLVGKGRAA